MDILNIKALECNRQIKINFDRGDLSSDAGLLLIREFTCKLGFVKILQSMFKTIIPQNFNKKLKRGTVSFDEMVKIAEVVGVGYEQAFVLTDGEKIEIKNE